ncbi:MAG: ABC transporter ATP-binding protein [Planctomycetota bacterium]
MSDERLRVHELAASFGDTTVFRDVSFTLDTGQVLTLIGPNGCGKSTLLRCLLGQLSHGGEAGWQVPMSRVAYLPQVPSFAEGQTVAEAIELGRVPHLGWFGVTGPRDRAAVASAAERVGVTDLLSRRMETLSGGQRRLVFIARALAQEPAVILLDEPDAHLDYAKLAELHGLLRGLSADGLSIVVASHDLNFAAAVADRVLMLGEPPAFGDTALLTDDRLRALFGVDLRVDNGGVRQRFGTG